MTLEQIIARAKRMKRIRHGLVLCDTCGTPASKDLSVKLGWTCCATCALGEADSFDDADLITVEAV